MPNLKKFKSLFADVKLSRSGRTSVRGKFDAVYPKFRTHDELVDRMRELAAKADCPLGEYTRTVLEAHAFGADQVAMMAAEQVLQVVRKVGH